MQQRDRQRVDLGRQAARRRPRGDGPSPRALGGEPGFHSVKLPDAQPHGPRPLPIANLSGRAASSSPARGTSLRRIVNVSHVAMG